MRCCPASVNTRAARMDADGNDGRDGGGVGPRWNCSSSPSAAPSRPCSSSPPSHSPGPGRPTRAAGPRRRRLDACSAGRPRTRSSPSSGRGSTPRPTKLRALGRELGAWPGGSPAGDPICGLDELLSGRYPPPDGPTPFVESPDGDWMPVPRRDEGRLDVEFRKTAVVDPWLYCPALVHAAEGMSSDEAIGSLERSIRPGWSAESATRSGEGGEGHRRSGRRPHPLVEAIWANLRLP